VTGGIKTGRETLKVCREGCGRVGVESLRYDGKPSSERGSVKTRSTKKAVPSSSR